LLHIEYSPYTFSQQKDQITRQFYGYWRLDCTIF